MRVTFLILALFALLAIGSADKHEMCCHKCHESYKHAHHLKHSCMRGCRLYSMIFLAHDKTIKQEEVEGMCTKSCRKSFSGLLGGADARGACAGGCSHQAAVFREHKPDHVSAKLSVIHGLTVLPLMHSAEPLHQRIFQHMREMHERMMKALSNARGGVQRVHIRIQSLPPGADGKPRYHVEIHQYPAVGRVNIMGRVRGHMHEHHRGHHGHHGHHGGHHGHHGGHHGHDNLVATDAHMVTIYEESRKDRVMRKIKHFFVDMPHGAKVALRLTLCGLLLLSVCGLLWLCCSTFRASRPNHRISLAKAFEKKPSVQSGDIFYVDVDKKPLMEAEETPNKDEA